MQANATTAVTTKKAHPITNRVGAVFMHVSNMERSANWYHKLFGMPDRSSATEKVHGIAMDGGSSFLLDQNGYDSGLKVDERPLLIFDSPDIDAAYRFVKESGIQIVEDIMRFPGIAFFTFRDPDGNLLMACCDSTKEANVTMPSTDETVEEIRYDAGGITLIARPNAHFAEVSSEGLKLTGNAETETSYATPLKIEAMVRIEGGCVQLTYGPHGAVSLNWGNSTDIQDKHTGSDLFIVHPKMNKHFTFLRKGSIPVGQWVRVEWTINDRKMEIHVNGELFHAQDGYFGDTVGKAGIAGVMGQVTVKSFSVAPLSDRDQVLSLPVGGDGKGDRLVGDPTCHAVETSDGLWLACDERWGYARTDREYGASFTMETVIRSDTRSVLIYGGHALCMKFNPEGSFCYIDPVTKEETWLEGVGLPYGDFATVTWKVEAHGISVAIDGATIFERKGDYTSCNFRLGIGAELGSAVTVKSLEIKQALIDNL